MPLASADHLILPGQAGCEHGQEPRASQSGSLGARYCLRWHNG